ncbi:MAG: SidA/IucD/PvdA family monooxygenase [Reyranella sp.]|nr:SidA/IucD/PvdA family monooxygenase [Reyranella sp.]
MSAGPVHPIVDFVAVGIGPANLSLAALRQPQRDITAQFYEQRPGLHWHEGTLLPDAAMQTSYLKDLVTPVDCTSPYSFLSFLQSHRRLYKFIIANFPMVTRVEFDQYLKWVSSRLSDLNYATRVHAVEYDRQFTVHHSRGSVRSNHIVLGMGLEPRMPESVRQNCSTTLFHSSQYLKCRSRFADKRVAVIGGGQTGAEVVADILRDESAAPAQLVWLSRRMNYLPLDDSPFTNELFLPSYSQFFHSLSARLREALVDEQKLASDGISHDTLERLYRRIYQLTYLSANRPPRIDLKPAHIVEEITAHHCGWRLQVRERLTDRTDDIDVDAAILCTGYEYRIPALLDPILDLCETAAGELRLNEDFSVRWRGPRQNRIYVQNGSRIGRGVADPNLSLVAWRSAKILNSIAQRTVYDVE